MIEGNRITRFAVHLPLSKDTEQVAGHGTRHAAALGLSEVTDALCLVVSEQKGTVSVASGEKLLELSDRSALEKEIAAFLRARTSAPQDHGQWTDVLLQHLHEKLLAVGFAVVLWLVFVRGIRPLHHVVK